MNEETETEESATPAVNPRPNMDSYRAHAKFVGQRLYLTGQAADWDVLAKVCAEASTRKGDGNGNITVQFDGEENMPIRQAGN
jgi:hypothetical protein